MTTTAAAGGLQEVAPGFAILDFHERGLAKHTGGWLVQGKTGSVIVEAGPGSGTVRWLQALPAAGIPLESITWILLTHIHLDHAACTSALLSHLPNARVGVHPRGLRHLVDPSRLIIQARSAWGDDFDAFGPMLPVPAERIVSLNEGDCIEQDHLRFRVINAPGHAPHQVCFFEESSRGLFNGDALGGIFPADGPFGEPMQMPGIAPPEGDLALFIETNLRLAELAPKKLYASHFGLIEPAYPYILGSMGQITLLWEICKQVHANGGTMLDAAARAYQTVAPVRTSNQMSQELHKEYRMVTEAAWNYVERTSRND